MTTNTKTKTPAVHNDIALFSSRPCIEYLPIDVLSHAIIPLYPKHQNKMVDDQRGGERGKMI